MAELTHGWWSITSTEYVDRLLRTLCIRGFREKGLYKALQKNKEIIAGSVNPASLKECEDSFKELLVAHQNNKLLPSITSSNSSSSSSSSSDSDDDSSGEGVKSEESDEEDNNNDDKMDASERDDGVKIKNNSDASTGEHVDATSADNNDQNTKEKVTTSSSSSSSSAALSEQDNPSAVGRTNHQQRTPAKQSSDQVTVAPPTSATPTTQIPASGIYDPTYPNMTLHVAVKVMEYIEAMQQRLITASLSVEVSVVLGMYV